MGTQKAIDTLDANLKVIGGSLVDKVKGVIVFDIGDRQWTLDLSSGNGSIKEGQSDEDADVTLSMSDDTFDKLVNGKTNPQQAFLFRKLKIKGAIGMAMKVVPVLSAAKGPVSKL